MKKSRLAAAAIFVILAQSVLTTTTCHAVGRIVAAESGGSGSQPPADLFTVKPNAATPQVGQTVPDVQWTDSQGKQQKLSQLTAEGRVVLLVLRGWPGYQCGICKRQVGDFLDNKAKLEELGVDVVMIYPGPADLLEQHAKEFQGDKLFTGSFHYVIDPDYAFTNAWGLRWDAPRETAYPSTYVIGKGNKVEFEKVSKTHGGRVSFAKVLPQLQD